jgi:Fe-coproporphyrin III synthase
MIAGSELEVATGLDSVRARMMSGEIALRKESDSYVLFGNAHDRYRIFQVVVTPLAGALLEMLGTGVGYWGIKDALIGAGTPEEQAQTHLHDLLSIADFDRRSLAIKYGVITEKLSAPINVTWDITNTCNLTCSYCYNSSGPVPDDGMTTEQCLDVVDQLADIGVFNVWIGGGEPLVKPGIERVLRRLKERNVKVLLATNGILVTKPKMLDLIGETCTEVNVSIDGHTDELHASLRGPTARLSTVANAVRAIKERFGDSVFVTALSVVHKGNLEAVPDIIDYAYELGCNKWTHNELYAMGRGNALKKLVMAHTEYDRFYELVTRKMKEYEGRMLVEDYVRMHKVTAPGEVAPFYGCVAGNQELSIQHNGDVYPCQKLQYPKYFCGNLVQTPLAEMWTQDPVLRWLRNRNVEDTECSGCGTFAAGQCNGGCLAEKEIHFERHDTRDPLCPENSGLYKDVLLDLIEYPYLSQPVREIIVR